MKVYKVVNVVSEYCTCIGLSDNRDTPYCAYCGNKRREWDKAR